MVNNPIIVQPTIPKVVEKEVSDPLLVYTPTPVADPLAITDTQKEVIETNTQVSIPSWLQVSTPTEPAVDPIGSQESITPIEDVIPENKEILITPDPIDTTAEATIIDNVPPHTEEVEAIPDWLQVKEDTSLASPLSTEDANVTN